MTEIHSPGWLQNFVGKGNFGNKYARDKRNCDDSTLLLIPAFASKNARNDLVIFTLPSFILEAIHLEAAKKTLKAFLQPA